ncbi:acyltransferase family protein [Vibrio breoganii]
MLTISKKDSDFIKGIAIILMLIHHFFAFPDRYPEGFIFSSDTITGKLVFEIALFGKICVPLFLFLSGYAYALIGEKDYGYYLSKIFRITRTYWLIFIVFIPLGFLFAPERYQFTLSEFISNLFYLSHSYNYEWWFLQPYILIVFIIPLYQKIRVNLFVVSIVFIISSVVFRRLDIDTPLISLVSLFYWLGVFSIGYSFNRVKLNVLTTSDFDKFLVIGISAFLLAMCLLFSRETFYNHILVVLMPAFVYLCLKMKKALNKFTIQTVEEIGKLSIYIWLSHTFLCYYIFKDYFYNIDNYYIAFVSFFMASLFCSLMIRKLENTIFKL